MPLSGWAANGGNVTEEIYEIKKLILRLLYLLVVNHDIHPCNYWNTYAVDNVESRSLNPFFSFSSKSPP